MANEQDIYYSMRFHAGAGIYGLVDAIANDQATPMGQVLALIAARSIQGGQSMTPADILKLQAQLQGSLPGQLATINRNMAALNSNINTLKRTTKEDLDDAIALYVLETAYKQKIAEIEQRLGIIQKLAEGAELEAHEAHDLAATGGTAPGGQSGGVVSAEPNLFEFESIYNLLGLRNTDKEGKEILTPTNSVQTQLTELQGDLNDLTSGHSDLEDAVNSWTTDFLLTRYEAFYFPPQFEGDTTAQMDVSRTVEIEGVEQTAVQVAVTEAFDDATGAVTYRIEHGLDTQFLFLEVFSTATGSPAIINWSVHDPTVAGRNESREYLWIHFKAKPVVEQFRILVKGRPERHHSALNDLINPPEFPKGVSVNG